MTYNVFGGTLNLALSIYGGRRKSGIFFLSTREWEPCLNLYCRWTVNCIICCLQIIHILAVLKI